MNKKADVEISETIKLLLYILIALVVIGIIVFLGKYLFNDIDLTKIFNLR
ncbi:hypothetical protein HYX16_04555 [Candidatus Woesearchaeota archaeon]|nr:hypothetical protein [Candidatus Woesearchaeota archaeon]